MSHTDAWKQTFNDSAGEVLPQYKQQCNHVEVLNDIALSLNMNEKMVQSRLRCTCRTRTLAGEMCR